MQTIGIHCIVRGRVQGVGFRYSAKIEADRLTLHGSVRNTPEGNVEIYACGTHADILTFIDWCKQGPSSAFVESLDFKFIPPTDDTTFNILRP